MAAQISAKLVKQLRDKSGAGMMDCKKALGESGGDFDAAVEYLRKKGLASADKKAGRVAAEGAIGSYIHAGSRCALCTGWRVLCNLCKAQATFSAGDHAVLTLLFGGRRQAPRAGRRPAHACVQQTGARAGWACWWR